MYLSDSDSLHAVGLTTGILDMFRARICPGALAQKEMAKSEWCHDPGLNQGPSDLQSDALPTELSRHNGSNVSWIVVTVEL